mmetsp:Transcript_54599/g.144273  ORF Transcript_54599/g.144273 Transcript_54599/m.144273 type:complete len:445 (+) Transcript_54599:15-1349(+)
MASKYRTKHSIPPGFPDILKDFVREILREQPENIYRFGAEYFEHKIAESGGRKLASEEDLVQMLSELFVQADKDGNGVLDKKEFKRLLMDADLGLSKKDIKLLYAQADINQDGNIEYREFIPACVELILTLQSFVDADQLRGAEDEEVEGMASDYFYNGMSKEEIENSLREAFNEADTDGSGYLDMNEFASYLQSLPLNLTRKEVNMAMVEVDANQDGKVSLDEFVPLFHTLMIQLIKREVLLARHSGNELVGLLVDHCREYDQSSTGLLRPTDLSKAIRDADLGLSKFQIASVVGRAPVRPDKLVEYESFFVQVGAPTIDAIMHTSKEMQLKRSKAWRLVREAEEEAEQVLGMTKDEFTRVLGSVFHQYDKDGSGSLDYDEFFIAVSNSGIEFTEDQVYMLMAAADVNDDGKIQYGEFANVALKLMEYASREENIQTEIEAME